MKKIIDLATALQRLGEKAAWLDVDTYAGWKTKARFIDPEFGEWWTLPQYVCDGHSHPQRGRTECAKKRTYSLAQALQRLGEKASWLDTSTYKGWKTKALFRHPTHGDWWTKPNTVAKGHMHPNDAAINRVNTNKLKYGKAVNYTPSSAENLSGQSFNNLTVLRPVHGRRYFWECLCTCGQLHITSGVNLRSGKTSSCGCKSYDAVKQRALNNNAMFIGQQFSKWTVIDIDPCDINRLQCKCDCGTMRTVNKSSLITGKTTNCGCLVISYATENTCRNILERMTGFKWPKQRIFKNPATGRLLELDGYCAELKAAFEYDGEQHYLESSWFDDIDSATMRLSYRQELDLIKTKCCECEGIKLLRIPYTQKNNLEVYIAQQLSILHLPINIGNSQED